MFNTKPLFLTITISILLSFFCTFVSAQSKKIKEALHSADRLYNQKKFDDAIGIYLQYTGNLSAEQQHQVALSYFAKAQKDPVNIKEAVDWVQKAIDAGNTDAMNSLAYCYDNGMGVTKDSSMGITWLEKSGALGNANALALLGFRYHSGKGVAVDKERAAELYGKSLDKGNRTVGYYLGLIRQDEGNGPEAIRYFKLAATDNILLAMLALGELYEKGKLIAKDPDEAVRWYTKIMDEDGFTKVHDKASDRIAAIGSVEPPVDLATVKPLLLKLIAGAGTAFSGLMGREVQPLRNRGIDLLSETTYYTCTVNAAFKNGLIKKEVVADKQFGEFRTRAGTFYSYSAEIVNSVSEEDANRIFEKWVNVFKAVLPAWNNKRDNENGRNFYIGGKLTNGKTINISLSVCCPASGMKQVYLRIESE